MNKIETLANYAHDAWIGWMKYLFSKCTLNIDGTVTIPKESVDRWMRQMDTTYQELSDGEKKSDREEAYKIMYIVEDRRDS